MNHSVLASIRVSSLLSMVFLYVVLEFRYGIFYITYDKSVRKLHGRIKIKCNSTVKLIPFPVENPDENKQIFFIESSLRGHFKGRVLCAFESALRRSQLPVKVILRSRTLSIDHPSLCSLIEEFYPDKLSFYTMGMEEAFYQTPIEGITDRLEWDIRHIHIQISDLMRSALVFKYGGFYFDNDVLILKELTKLRNTIGIDNVTTYPNEKCEATTVEKSFLLNPGNMHFDKHNPFVKKYLTFVNKTYRYGLGWFQLGPGKMHKTASRFLGRKGQPSIPMSTPDLTIVPSFILRQTCNFSEVKAPEMFDVDVDGSYFEEYLRCSHIVHLLGKLSKTANISGNPRNDVYSYLGPKICPKSIAQIDLF
ncbi:uncharacterized protein LOC142356309 [Convolutriloba macropyga]|uniref:uncharacterized protein LOC142356309 n=1 Tax=Convolutriloba macropyga TaxID=536237 RepID=UPI003F527379